MVSSPNSSLLCWVIGVELVDVVVKSHLCQQVNRTQGEVDTARRSHLFSSLPPESYCELSQGLVFVA
jgi:hypothetical protein